MVKRKITPKRHREASPRAPALAMATRQRARLIGAQAELSELKARRMRDELVDAAAVETEWASIARTIRAGMLTVPSRVAALLPHLTKHDVSEIDAEVRAVLTEIGGS